MPVGPLTALRPAGRLGAVGVGRYSNAQPETTRIASAHGRVKALRAYSAALRPFG